MSPVTENNARLSPVAHPRSGARTPERLPAARLDLVVRTAVRMRTGAPTPEPTPAARPGPSRTPRSASGLTARGPGQVTAATEKRPSGRDAFGLAAPRCCPGRGGDGLALRRGREAFGFAATHCPGRDPHGLAAPRSRPGCGRDGLALRRGRDAFGLAAPRCCPARDPYALAARRCRPGHDPRALTAPPRHPGRDPDGLAPPRGRGRVAPPPSASHALRAPHGRGGPGDTPLPTSTPGR
ncbi:hypothetical protein RKD23_005539 [Streptomyces sp. SAI-170]